MREASGSGASRDLSVRGDEMNGCRRYVAAMLVGAAVASAAHSQEKAAPLEFEVATVRLTKPGTLNGGIKATAGGTGYTATNVPVKLMISLMYRVPMRQIKGVPDWATSDGYDVEAKADKQYSLDDLHTMYQNLLADRFKLTFHKEVHEGNAYVLTVDKALKMTLNTGPQDYEIPILPKGIGMWTGRRVPIPYLCWNLGQQLQQDERPVVDMTGLTGNYDFTLLWLPDLPPDFPKENLPADALDRPRLIDAVRDQLGLKLSAQKGPVEYLVIDRLERASAN